MRTKKQSGIVLVYDRFYGKKPSPFIQSLKKTLYCTALCIFAMLFIAEEYKMPVSLWAAAGFSALFSVIFCVTFSFVKKKIAIPIFLFFSGIIILFNRESLWERFSYFTDLFWLRLNGIMFYTEKYTFHTQRQLVGSYPSCADGVLLGIAAVCCIFALLTAACMFRKPVIFPSFFVFVLLSAPVAVAGNFEFNFWIIPATALYVGAFALSKSYSEGTAVKKGFIGSFRAESRKEEREFRNKAAKVPFVKRVGMNGVYYSKYISTACLGAAIFSAAAFIANCFAPVREGFDYKDFYSFLNSLTQSSGISSPFESGPVSQYFTAYGSGSSSLNIVSPGNGQQEILRVSSPGSEVYLRGDIGIDFTGNSWTSPIIKESPLWKKGKLQEKYRPAEMRILQIMEQSYREDLKKTITLKPDSSDDNINNASSQISVTITDPKAYKIPEGASIAESEVIVNYLCQTDVVFLPAYPSEFGFFENEMFDVYGDFSVRVNENYDKINSVKVDALVPAVAYSGVSSDTRTEIFNYLADVAENYPMNEIFDRYFDEDGIYLDYKDYVYGTYLNVPNSLKSDIRRYLLENGLYTNVYSGGKADIKAGYQAAVKITDFLLENYTYSLDAKKNLSNPIMSFLNDTKSGHCALFASSMTMMLRDMGIPARYCTGFVAPKTHEGQFAILRSKNLHAWCEAYFDGIGWVTFDPTSSSVAGMVEIEGESNSSEEQSDSSESSDSSDSSNIDSDNSEDPYEDPDESDEESDSTHEGNNDNSDNSSENSKINFVPFILIALAVIAVSSCVVLVIVKFRKLDGQAKRTLKDARYNGSCEELYAKIIAILDLCGYKQRPGEQPKQFFARVDAHFKTKLSKNSKMLMKIAFGKDETSPEEIFETALLLEGLFASADAQLIAFDSVRLRKIILSKK